MKIVYIHGNRATANSFNFIRGKISGFEEIVIEYDSATGFYKNHAFMLDKLVGLDDIFFIAHSLGGLHALHLAHALGDRVVGGVTMSTPYGGCKIAEMMAYFLPYSQVMKDIRPNSSPITEGHHIALTVPWANLVSTVGSSPFLVILNDGVVTQKSMRHRQDIDLIDVACNHFEILLHEDTVAILNSKLAAMKLPDLMMA